VSKATHTYTTRGRCSPGRQTLHVLSAMAACAALAGAVFMLATVMP
jgi:hypothetical protein